MRGALPSPRHRLAAAKPHVVATPTPVQWLWKPAQLSMWLNATYGDCVTAEEAFAKGCGPMGAFIPDAEVQNWATKNGVLNGAADLVQVLDLMQTGGFPTKDSILDDGPFTSVDWTNHAILTNAISLGPVKIGVAANQLENAVPGDPPVNGWVARGFTPDSNEDHCVSLAGFGTIEWLVEQLGVAASGLSSDHRHHGHDPAYALFTWGSLGIIDIPSMLAITSEAWLRNPTTVIASTTAQ